MSGPVPAARAYPETTYERWLRQEGLPVVEGHGVEDLLALPRGDWPRLGGKGCFVKLQGMEGLTGMYLVEIPPGGVLKPEKHLYEKIIYVLQGVGSAEVAQPGAGSGVRFEWSAGSLFAIPLNTVHRFFNGSGQEPAVLLGFTNAPLVLDLFHRPDFVFGDDFIFDDRFSASGDFFAPGTTDRYQHELAPILTWETNFAPDVRTLNLDSGEYKGPGRSSTLLEMGGGVLVSHVAEWPGGRHDKAHYHSAGAVLLMLSGIGYSLMWPVEAGPRPYEAGKSEQVVKVNWRAGSAFSPPSGWFHQHFNTGTGTARCVALRYGTRHVGVEFVDVFRRAGAHISIRDGGTMIDYADQDPQITADFAAACAANGAPVTMPSR